MSKRKSDFKQFELRMHAQERSLAEICLHKYRNSYLMCSPIATFICRKREIY